MAIKMLKPNKQRKWLHSSGKNVQKPSRHGADKSRWVCPLRSWAGRWSKICGWFGMEWTWKSWTCFLKASSMGNWCLACGFDWSYKCACMLGNRASGNPHGDGKGVKLTCKRHLKKCERITAPLTNLPLQSDTFFKTSVPPLWYPTRRTLCQHSLVLQ